jgi:transcriptional regulator with XRE-family HTH domain
MSHSSTNIVTERALDRAFSRWYAARATGLRVRWARESAYVTRDELAERAGMCRRTIVRIEDGERAPTGRELATISRALDVSIGFLKGGPYSGNGRRAA